MGCQKTENYVNAFYERSLTKMATSSTYRMPRFFAYRYIFFFQSCNSPRLDIRSQTFTNNDLLFFSCRKKVQVQGAISFEPVECWGVSSWWLQKGIISTNFNVTAVDVSKFLHFSMDMRYYTGNALAWVQRVHEPADVWNIIFCTRRFWLFNYISENQQFY